MGLTSQGKRQPPPLKTSCVIYYTGELSIDQAQQKLSHGVS
ncbi:protein of unknown function (plasmid) [Lactiplantibacillus plantarum]